MGIFVFRKVKVFISIVTVLFLLLTISCEKKSKSHDNEVEFETIQEDKTQSVNFKKSKLNCNLHISFTYPVSCKKTAQLSDLQTLFIEKIFPPRYAILSPHEAMNSFSSQYIRDFQSTKFEDYFSEDYVLEDEKDYFYELRLENEILYNRNNFISFVVKNTNYEGGAHGSNSIYGYVIDLNTGKLLTEDDFAGNNYKKYLSSIIVQKITSARGFDNVSQLESNGYNAVEDIIPNDNFTIDDKGITYYFNEYEIAAYFVGITEVFISFEELKAYITNDNPLSSLAGI